MSEKEFKYRIVLSFNLGKAVAKVDDFAEGITGTMNEFGFEGKFIIRSQIPIIMTSNVRLNGEHINLLKSELEKGMNRFQMWSWRVESMRLLKRKEYGK